MLIHVRAELAQRLVEVVHLRENADHHHNPKDISRRMAELVVPAQGQFDRDSEALDGHDGYTAHAGADAEIDHGVLLAVDRRDLVDHDNRECRDKGAIYQKTCLRETVSMSPLTPNLSLLNVGVYSV